MNTEQKKINTLQYFGQFLKKRNYKIKRTEEDKQAIKQLLYNTGDKLELMQRKMDEMELKVKKSFAKVARKEKLLNIFF